MLLLYKLLFDSYILCVVVKNKKRNESYLQLYDLYSNHLIRGILLFSIISCILSSFSFAIVINLILSIFLGSSVSLYIILFRKYFSSFFKKI